MKDTLVTDFIDYKEVVAIQPTYPAHHRNSFGFNAFLVLPNKEKVAYVYGNEWIGYSPDHDKDSLISQPSPINHCGGTISIDNMRKLSKALRACAGRDDELHHVKQRIYFQDGNGERDYIQIDSPSNAFERCGGPGLLEHGQQTKANICIWMQRFDDKEVDSVGFVGWFVPEECDRLAGHINRILEEN